MLKEYLKSLPEEDRDEAIADLALEVPSNPDWTPEQYDSWLHDWVHIYFDIYIPKVQVCRDHVAPFKAFADAFFARHSIMLWEGSRGLSGKTVQLATLTSAEATLLGVPCNLLGGSGEQSQNVNEYLNGTNPRLKDKLFEAPYAPDVINNAYSKIVTFKTGGRIKALMASPRSVRGPHPVRLRIDEDDEAELSIIESALGQTMDLEGVPAQTVLSSTHQHADGTRTALKARAKKRNWPIYSWCLFETMKPHGWLTQELADKKKNEVSDEAWENEYLLNEPSIEGRLFNSEQLNFLFDRRLGEFKGDEGEMCRIEKPRGMACNSGVDWAKQQHYTVIVTAEEHSDGPDLIVAFERIRRRPWPEIIGQYNKRIMDYGGKACHDSTGVGDVVQDYLVVDSDGFNFSAYDEAKNMINSFVGAVQRKEYKMPYIEYAYNTLKYVTQEHVDNKKHRPDVLAALALMHRAKRTTSNPFLIGR